MNPAEGLLSVTIRAADRPGLLRDLASKVAAHLGNIESVHLTPALEPEQPVETHLEISKCDDSPALIEELRDVTGVHSVSVNEPLGAIFGKRVIVMGGGAQVAQVVLGAVSEADRHNLRGERISVDTIPLVGEETLAEAIRAVARVPRARILVIAGSLMGGEITHAVRDLRACGIPVIALNMAGSVTQAADLVVTDPVQAGVISVMAIANTAKFDLERVRGRTF